MTPPIQLTAFLISSPLTKDWKTLRHEKIDLRKAHILKLCASFRLLNHPCRIFSRFWLLQNYLAFLYAERIWCTLSSRSVVGWLILEMGSSACASVHTVLLYWCFYQNFFSRICSHVFYIFLHFLSEWFPCLCLGLRDKFHYTYIAIKYSILNLAKYFTVQ